MIAPAASTALRCSLDDMRGRSGIGLTTSVLQEKQQKTIERPPVGKRTIIPGLFAFLMIHLVEERTRGFLFECYRDRESRLGSGRRAI